MKKFLAFILSLVFIFSIGCQEAPVEKLENNIYVYFLDVGQADCTFISLNGKTMLIDGGNVEDGPDVVRFIKKMGFDTIDTVVATHAHEDHVGGLATIIDSFKVNKIYSPTDSYSSTCFEEFVDAANRQCGITLCTRGASWSIDLATASVLWPAYTVGLEPNNTSIVIMLSYGEISFLFTGDLEKDAETQLVESGVSLDADILKVGHHGSETSTGYFFLRSVLPQVGIISCGKGNSYGHPHKEPLERLEQAEVKIYRTDQLGTITVISDGETFNIQYGETEEYFKNEHSAPALQVYYIGNKKSKKFHVPTCSGLPKEENRAIFYSREEAINAEYSPCGLCKP